jgi:uncharacterized protein YjiS (DUF1127 family)
MNPAQVKTKDIAMSLIPDRIPDGAHRSLAPVGLDYDHHIARARRLRAEAVSDAGAAAGRGLRRLASACIGAFREWRRRRRAVAELWSMDDRLLRDMGLARSSIHYVIDHGREDVPAPANTNAAEKVA